MNEENKLDFPESVKQEYLRHMDRDFVKSLERSYLPDDVKELIPQLARVARVIADNPTVTTEDIRYYLGQLQEALDECVDTCRLVDTLQERAKSSLAQAREAHRPT